MSQFFRLWIVIFCASSGSFAALSATAQPPDAPAPAAPQEIIAPAASVPTNPPRAVPEPGPLAPQLSALPAAVVPPPANFSVESEVVAAVCEKIEQALNATAEVNFNEAPLSEVANYLRETYQIPIIIDKRALDDVGMGSDTPVTISIHGVSLCSVLKHMLKELDLTYVVCDQVLKITTPEEAEKELVLHAYSVADLAVTPRPSLIVDEPESDYTTIQRLISGNIAPNSWDDVGGAGVSWPVDPWGILVVSQTRENHEALESLLAAVRKARRSAEGATGTPTDWQPIPVTSDVTVAAHSKIEQALKAAAIVEFQETPLSDFVRYLQDTFQIPIVIDKRALDDVGMGSDTPVTMSISGISLRSVLHLMLKELDLTYVVRNEVLKITTPEVAQNELVTFVYPVRDFLVPSSQARNSHKPDESPNSLPDMIEATVAPHTWDHVGGAGVISPIEPWGLLVISQTAEVHEQVNNLLQATRRARDASPAAASAPPLTTPTALVPGGALLVPPPPPTVLPPAADPATPLTPVLTIPGPIDTATPLGFVSASGEEMILKVYAVPDFDADQLKTVIRGVVAPETWGNGANMAVIFPLGTRILIRQTPAAHAEIQELIDRLRPH